MDRISSSVSKGELRRNERLCRAVAMLRRLGMTDDVWGRVQAIASRRSRTESSCALRAAIRFSTICCRTRSLAGQILTEAFVLRSLVVAAART